MAWEFTPDSTETYEVKENGVFKYNIYSAPGVKIHLNDDEELWCRGVAYSKNGVVHTTTSGSFIVPITGKYLVNGSSVNLPAGTTIDASKLAGMFNYDDWSSGKSDITTKDPTVLKARCYICDKDIKSYQYWDFQQSKYKVVMKCCSKEECKFLTEEEIKTVNDQGHWIAFLF